MTALHVARPLSDAIIVVLSGANLTVGDGEKPTGGGWQGTAGASDFVPYVVMYPLGGSTDGTLDAPDEDADARYQLSSIGASRAQCELVADKARQALLTAVLVVPGRQVAVIRGDGLGEARRDDQGQPPLWFSPDRYRIRTEPS